MVTWADLCGLLMVVGGSLAGMVAARDCGASTPIMVLSSFAGFVFALVVGEVSARAAFSVLRSESLSIGWSLALYMVIPVPGLGLVVFGPIVVAEMVMCWGQ